jgi:hypothetical protein
MRLSAEKVVTWSDASALPGVTPGKVYIGPDPFGLGGFQVAVAEALTAPTRTELRELFAARKGKTQVQLVVAVSHDGKAHLFGPDPQSVPIEMSVEHAVRQLQSVLSEPDVVAATQRFVGFRKAADSVGVAGFTNSGLFASHHIARNVPSRSDWKSLGDHARPLLSKRGKDLIAALGFRVATGPNGTLVLSIGDHPPRAVAILLDDTEQFEAKTQRFQLSPVAFGLAVAARQEVPWLVVLRKDQIRLYPGRDGVGVGSKGQAETFFEIDLSVVDAEFAALLPLVFSAEALSQGGTADDLLRDSARYASELGARLRERVYGEIVPPLAVEVADRLHADAGVALDSEGLALAYRVTLRILFRLLFQAYAEDRGLLPSGRNEAFDANSLKANARRLLNSKPEDFGDSSTIWFDLVQVWSAIDYGNPQWQIPAYNGGLFSSDTARSAEGALIKQIEVPDRVLGPALKSMLIDVTGDGVLGPVDFRSLSVREFGTIYEGLLESSLSLAAEDLTLNAASAWVPAAAGDEVYAPAGSVYFHTASGERKATGSYFTPKVVVDHLIERSVVPILTAHLGKISEHLKRGDSAAAARDFFDFRVADLAMGSGHFLVAAVDKVESLMRSFLTEHSVPEVAEELARLALVAQEALGTDDVAKSEVDAIGLLRRQIARRCIYGLDINPMAVDLARLAIWIHTFVPGLPMSNLDHGLVCANSLTGIGSVEEALNCLQPDRKPGYLTFFDDVLLESLAEAKGLLIDVANASEASKAEVEAGARLLSQARQAAETASRVFDAAIAARLGWIDPGLIMDKNSLDRLLERDELDEVQRDLQPAHMPYLFPEVFLREEPGFDVILGNPPWEELMVEEPKFWLRIRPGLLGLKPVELKAEIARLRKERPDLVVELERQVELVASQRKVLLKGPYPGLGTGDIDLYQAFSWRFWQLLRGSGRIAVVVPRSLLISAGGAEWRKAVLSRAYSELVSLKNTAGWIFEGVAAQYTVVLIVLDKASASAGMLNIAGPFYSQAEFLNGRANLGPLSWDSVTRASVTNSIPNLPDPLSVEVFTQIRRAPRLDDSRPGWDFRPVAEFHATNDRATFDAGGEVPGRYPVRGGAGFDMWAPETSEIYAWSDPGTVEDALMARRHRQISLKSSAFFGKPREWADDRGSLPLHHPRIAFRDVCRATDTRTCIVALLPPQTVLTNKAPYLLQRDGGRTEEAFLLGVLSSIPLDWYARRYVELNLNFHVFNSLPIPDIATGGRFVNRIVEISGRLAAVDDRYLDWAAEVGVPVGSVTSQAEKEGLIAEIDALVSLLYGLTEDQVKHVFATFHRGWDYQPRLDAVLAHYAAWKDKA